MTHRIPVRFGRLGWLLRIAGMPERATYLELDETTLAVHGGIWFRASIPRPTIVSVTRGPDRPWSIGVHGWRGAWIVNGAASPMARIAIDPPAPARSIGFRIGLRALEVSVADPDALADALLPDPGRARRQASRPEPTRT
jgi:hypothetical protein